jgi:hypothetical protein
MKKPVSELREGDFVDLEGDSFADPSHDKPELEHEYARVVEYELETPECLCVYFDCITVGFPLDHMVEVIVPEAS